MFVTIEGLDGAGKDTALDAIRTEWPGAITTSEPSELWTGKNVRRVLSDDNTNPLVDFYLFMADRVHHIENIVRQQDEAGTLVVSGRYADSTRVYQPVAMTDAGVFDSGWEAKLFIEQTMEPWNYEPDLTIYLDISVDTALARASQDEKYEKRQFLEGVRDNYEALLTSDKYGDRFVRVDAEQPEDAVREEVVEVIAAAYDPTGAVEGW